MLYPFFRNYEAGAVWLSLRSILGRARGTREWERRTPLLLSHRASSTLLLSPSAPAAAPPPQKKMIGYDEGTYSATFMRVSKQGMNLPETDQGRGR